METVKFPRLKLTLCGLLAFLPLTYLLMATGCGGTFPSSSAVPGVILGANKSVMLTGVPDVRQAEYYSCGASSFQAVLSYYGMNSFETDLRQMLNTTNTHGTYSWDMVKVAKQLGFDAEWKENQTLDDVEASLRQGVPVIVRMEQVKATGKTWADTWTVGHYRVVIGLDAQNVYMEDPYLLGTRLKMTRDDFNAAWHCYISEVPIPPEAPKSYHHAVFIRGTPPAERPEFIGPDATPPVIPPYIVWITTTQPAN